MIVDGNAGKAAGSHMGNRNFSKGTSVLRIYGNAGPDAGFEMIEGIIFIHGDATAIGRNSSKLSEFRVGGNISRGDSIYVRFDNRIMDFVDASYGECDIYQRGKLLVKQGVVIEAPENK
jgi:formylmethanofuran dehydrogenase subunit C